MARQRLVQTRIPGQLYHGLNCSRVVTAFTVPRKFDRKRSRLETIFIPMGGPEAHVNSILTARPAILATAGLCVLGSQDRVLTFCRHFVKRQLRIESPRLPSEHTSNIDRPYYVQAKTNIRGSTQPSQSSKSPAQSGTEAIIGLRGIRRRTAVVVKIVAGVRIEMAGDSQSR
jgi:hypothetical protein